MCGSWSKTARSQGTIFASTRIFSVVLGVWYVWHAEIDCRVQSIRQCRYIFDNGTGIKQMKKLQDNWLLFDQLYRMMLNCVTFTIFAKFSSWFNWLGFWMGVEMWDSSTVTGMIPSFSVSLRELMECGISIDCGVVLIVKIRQFLSITSGLWLLSSWPCLLLP